MKRAAVGIAGLLVAVALAVVAWRHATRFDSAWGRLLAAGDEQALLVRYREGEVQVARVDAAGVAAWTRELDCGDDLRLDDRTCGALVAAVDAASNTVVVSAGHALDFDTGATRWRVERSARPPVSLLGIDDGRVVVVDRSPAVVEVVDAATGGTRWERELGGEKLTYYRRLEEHFFACHTACTAFAWDDGAPRPSWVSPGRFCSVGERFVGFAEETLRWGDALTPTGAASAGDSAWLFHGGPKSLVCARRGGHVVLGARYRSPALPTSLRLMAIDIESGRVAWRLDVPAAGVVSVEPGHAPSDFTPLRDEVPRFVPVRAGHDLVAIDLERGEEVWRRSSERTHVDFELLVAGGRPYVRSGHGLTVFDGATGTLGARLGVHGAVTATGAAVWIHDAGVVGQLDPVTLEPNPAAAAIVRRLGGDELGW